MRQGEQGEWDSDITVRGVLEALAGAVLLIFVFLAVAGLLVWADVVLNG